MCFCKLPETQVQTQEEVLGGMSMVQRLAESQKIATQNYYYLSMLGTDLLEETGQQEIHLWEYQLKSK